MDNQLPRKQNFARKNCTQRQGQDPQQTQQEALPTQQPSQILNQSQVSSQQRDENPFQEFMNFEQFPDFGIKRQRTSLQTEINTTNNLKTDLLSSIMPTPFQDQVNQTQNNNPGTIDFNFDWFFTSIQAHKEDIQKLPSLTFNDQEILLEFDKIFSLVTDDYDIQCKDPSIQKIKDFDSIIEDIDSDLSRNRIISRIILITFAKIWEENCSNVKIRYILKRLQNLDACIESTRQFQIYDKYQEIFKKSIKSILLEISVEDQLSSEAFKGASSQVSRDQAGQLVQGNDMRLSNIERTALEKVVQYLSSKDQEFKNMMENLYAQTGAKTDSEKMEEVSSKQKK
eukprot:403372057